MRTFVYSLNRHKHLQNNEILLEQETIRAKDCHELRIITYNVLNAELAERPRHGPYSLHDRSWEKRKKHILKELISYSSDIILLQEVTSMMAIDLEEELKPLGYHLLRPSIDLGKLEAVDLPNQYCDAHSPVTFVRDSAFLRLDSWHVVQLDQLGLGSFPIITSSDEELFRRYIDVGKGAYAIVAQVSHMVEKDKWIDITIGNVHLHHDPLEPHIKALQACEIVNYIQKKSKCSAIDSSLSKGYFVIGGDFNSIVQKHEPDQFDEVAGTNEVGRWDGSCPLPSGVYQLLTQSRLEATHPDHPANRIKGASTKPLLIDRPLVSAYKHARGKEPHLTTKCLDFAATLDYIFVDAVAARAGVVDVLSTLSLPYNDTVESSIWMGIEKVSSIAPELGCSIPSQDFASDHIALGCDISFSLAKTSTLSVLAIGGADTFFKVGHFALRLLHKEVGVHLRLVLPTIEEAKKTCHDMPGLEYATFDYRNLLTIEPLCLGFDALILVPPLDGDCVEFSRTILELAKKGGVKQVVCIGGQCLGNEIYPRPFSKTIEKLCSEIGIEMVTIIRTPFFLENLLWHTSRIFYGDCFSYPCSGDLPFPYISCQDVGELVGTLILKRVAPKRIDLTSNRFTTSMNSIASMLEHALKKTVKFKKVSPGEFIDDLALQKITRVGAEEMIALWNDLAVMKEVTSTGNENFTIEYFLMREQISIENWLNSHLCCFNKSVSCKHAQPPRPHAHLVPDVHSRSTTPESFLSNDLEVSSPILESNYLDFSIPILDTMTPRSRPSGLLESSLDIRFTCFIGLKYKVSAVSLSEDGSWIAASCISDIGDGGMIIIYSVLTGKEHLRISSSEISSVQSLSFVNREGEDIIISGTQEGVICFWDVQTGNQLIKHTGEHSSGISCIISFSVYCASASFDKTVKLWNAQSLLSHRTLLHDSPVCSIAISPDLKTLISCTLALSIVLWDLRSFKLITTFESGHRDMILSVCTLKVPCHSIFAPFSNFDFLLVTASKDKTCRLLSPLGDLIYELDGHTDYVRSVKYDASSQQLITASDDSKIKFWFIANGRCIKTVNDISEVRRLTHVHLDGSFFVSGNRQGCLKLWYTTNHELMECFLEGHTNWVQSVAVSHNGSLIFSGSDDGYCCVWDTSLMECIIRINCKEVVRSVAASNDGDIFIVGGGATMNDTAAKQTPFLSIFMLNSCEKPLFDLSGISHTLTIRSVAMSSNGKLAFSGADDKQICVWDAAKGELLQSITENENSVRGVTLSRSMLASACWDGLARIWLIDSQTNLYSNMKLYRGHRTPCRTVSITPNEKVLASGSFDDIRVWDIATAQCLYIITDHADAIDTIIATDNWLYSGSHNSKIKIHWLSNGVCMRTLKGHSSGVTCLALSQSTLYSGSRDHTIRWYKLGTISQQLVYALRANDSSAAGILIDIKSLLQDGENLDTLLDIALRTVLEADHDNCPLWHKLILNDENDILVGTMVNKYKGLAYLMHPTLKRSAYDLTTGSVRSKMDETLFFCGRFKICTGTFVHKSKTAIVLPAVDMTKDDSVISKNVVIKLMKNENQFNSELEQRNTLSDNFVVPILIHSKSEPLTNRWDDDIRVLEVGQYDFGIIMEAAEKNLMVVIAQERLQIDEIRNIMMQLGACLQHLHLNGFLHADFKPLNAVRTSSSHIWKLIDLDASCKLGCDYVGKKVSTAYIPPECLKRNDDLESIEVVPLLASTSFDLWSFGVVLYHMLTGQPLFHSNNDDNLASSEELAKLYHWDDFEFEEKLVSLIPSVDRRSCVAKSLLGWLLTRDPTMRPQSMQQVLDHNFFQSDPTKGITRVTRGFFISHAQESGGVQSRAIKRMLADACPLLQKPIQSHLEDPIWLDVDEDPVKENMVQGVRRCQNIILFLTKGTLRRWFCQLEIREAMRLSKNIILVHDEPSLDPNFGGYTSFDGYIEDSRVGDAIEIEGKFGNTTSLFDSIVSIPYYHRKEFTEVSIQAILKAGGFDTNETTPRSFVNSPYNVLESVKPLIMRQQYQNAVNILQGVINSPLDKVTVNDEFQSSKHLNVLILYEKMSHQTVTELKLLIERDFPFLANKVVVGTDLNHNLEEYSHLIIYVTIGVFRDSLVLKNLESLDRISSKVIFVHATDARHRAAKQFNDVIENAIIDENKLIYIKNLFYASGESSEWGQSIAYYSQNSEFRTVSIKLIVKEILEK